MPTPAAIDSWGDRKPPLNPRLKSGVRGAGAWPLNEKAGHVYDPVNANRSAINGATWAQEGWRTTTAGIQIPYLNRYLLTGDLSILVWVVRESADWNYRGELLTTSSHQANSPWGITIWYTHFAWRRLGSTLGGFDEVLRSTAIPSSVPARTCFGATVRGTEVILYAHGQPIGSHTDAGVRTESNQVYVGLGTSSDATANEQFAGIIRGALVADQCFSPGAMNAYAFDPGRAYQVPSLALGWQQAAAAAGSVVPAAMFNYRQRRG
jgi:hypothetical protein